MLTEGAIAVDRFAALIAKIADSEMKLLRELVKKTSMNLVRGRYYTAEVDYDAANVARAFLIMLLPGGSIPRHHDEFIKNVTHHLVIETNRHAFNYWIDTKGKERRIHMKEGYRYRVERSPLHWVVNDGKTNRTHLLLELK